MDNLLDSVGNFILAYPAWRSALIAAGILIQGELTILLSLYFIENGSLTWMSFLTPALAGLFIGEGLVYFLGRTMRVTRPGWRWYYKMKDNKRLQTYTYFLKTNLVKLFVIAKFLPATNFLILFLTGWSKTKFGPFLKSYALSVFIWFTAITAIAYPFTSALYHLRAAKIFREAEIGIVAVFLLIFAGEYVLRRFLKKVTAVVEKSELIGAAVEEKIKKNLTSDEQS